MFIQRKCIPLICAKLLFSAPIEDAGEIFNGMWSGWRDISIALANFKKKTTTHPSYTLHHGLNRETSTDNCYNNSKVPLNLHSALSVWVWDLWISWFPLKVQMPRVNSSVTTSDFSWPGPTHPNLTDYTKVWLDSGPEWCRNALGCPDVQEIVGTVLTGYSPLRNGRVLEPAGQKLRGKHSCLWRALQSWLI